MKGKQIKTVEALAIAAENKRAVIGSHAMEKPKPAIFALNMNCTVVLRHIRDGLFIYEKGEK